LRRVLSNIAYLLRWAARNRDKSEAEGLGELERFHYWPIRVAENPFRAIRHINNLDLTNSPERREFNNKVRGRADPIRRESTKDKGYGVACGKLAGGVCQSRAGNQPYSVNTPLTNSNFRIRASPALQKTLINTVDVYVF
jgi:hypothetical protein